MVNDKTKALLSKGKKKGKPNLKSLGGGKVCPYLIVVSSSSRVIPTHSVILMFVHLFLYHPDHSPRLPFPLLFLLSIPPLLLYSPAFFTYGSSCVTSYPTHNPLSSKLSRLVHGLFIFCRVFDSFVQAAAADAFGGLSRGGGGADDYDDFM